MSEPCGCDGPCVGVEKCYDLPGSTLLSVVFPRLRFAEENGLAKQISHIDSELVEVRDSYFKPDIMDTARELVDLMQSTATALYIIEKDHGICLADVVKWVQDKNKARGYE